MTYIYKEIEEYEFPAKIISGGRITIPENIRESGWINDGDMVSIIMSVIRKTPSIELYLFNDDKIKPQKDALTKLAEEEYRLAQFSVERYEIPLQLNPGERDDYRIQPNSAFMLLGVKIISRNGWGTYGIYRGNERLRAFTIPDHPKLDDGIILSECTFYEDDILKIYRFSREGSIRLELIGLSLTPPGSKDPVVPIDSINEKPRRLSESLMDELKYRQKKVE